MPQDSPCSHVASIVSVNTETSETNYTTKEIESDISWDSISHNMFSAVLRRLSDKLSISQTGRRKALRSRSLLVVGLAVVLAIIISLVWWALIITFIHRLRPPAQSGALQSIIQSWRTANDSINLLSPWPEDLTKDIIAKPCHSHNDYSRKIPLYDALAAGCTGVEADVWLPDNDNGTSLRFFHLHGSLTADRTLASLYVESLSKILRNLNPDNTTPTGIFETDSNQTLVLLIDFKSDGTQLWPLVNAQLGPLRQDGWLRYWNGTSGKITPGPLTVVASGNAPYDLVVANHTYRDIFFDAPLDDVSSDLYNSTNSYYASAKLSKAVGSPVFGRFKASSMRAMTTQIEEAEDKGLVSRYWGTPAWPVSVRDRVWSVLVKSRVGMLNVDDLESATRWNWDWCVVAGLTLCG